ncbi:MAG: AraC family transcriptional regulator [Planctomycetota bacterium]
MAGNPESTDGDAVRALCGSVFKAPDPIEQVTHHGVGRALTIAPHRHPWMVQFDLMIRCGGRATTADGASEISRCTVMTTWPGELHGYDLRGSSDDAHVYHLKLAVRRQRSLVDAKPFPRLVTDRPEPTALRRAFDDVVRLQDAHPATYPLFLASVARLLALWPTTSGSSVPGGQMVAEAILTGTQPDRRLPVAELVELIDRRLDNPPSLDELAGVSHVSTRHFARLFKSVMGCTPLSFINARRLNAARQLLADPDRSIREVSRTLGFTSPPGFTRWFRQQSGVTPQGYRDDPTRL